MVVVLRLIPVLLSMVLLAAHFSRAGSSVLALIALLFPLVLLVRRPWAARMVQFALVLGGLEWLRAMRGYVRQRMIAGEPWGRLVLILGVVALLTAASALVFRSPRLRSVWFGEQMSESGPASGE